MENFEFLSYELTPGEKYYGIATVRAWGKIILKFKVMPLKDTSGMFASVASYKIGVKPDGTERFEKVFSLDSLYESNQLKEFIDAHVKAWYSKNQPQKAQTTQAPPPPLRRGEYLASDGKFYPITGTDFPL